MNSFWKYHITLYTDNWDEIQDWCTCHIGEFDRDWYKLGVDPAQFIIDGIPKTTWWFNKEKDIILFKLRWS